MNKELAEDNFLSSFIKTCPTHAWETKVEANVMTMVTMGNCQIFGHFRRFSMLLNY